MWYANLYSEHRKWKLTNTSIIHVYYWRILDAAASEPAWPQVVADATRIVQEAGVALASYRGLPVFSVGEGITLNGAESEDYETFHMDKDGGDRGFCKTARRPCDVVVTSILLRASIVACKAIYVR
jgi:hypothetical protein